MDDTPELPASVLYRETDSGEWYEIEFKSIAQAELVRDSNKAPLHETDDERKKTVRLSVATPRTTLEQLGKQGIEKQGVPESWEDVP